MKINNQVRPSTPISVLIMDDHPAILLGLSSMLSETDHLQVVGTLRNGTELQDLPAETKPDVVLMDLRMPGLSGTESIRLLRRKFPRTRILLISSYEVEQEIVHALAIGASGFVSKNADENEIVSAIRKVHAGGKWISTGLSRKLSAHTQMEVLSPRELQILDAVARGLTNREIAQQLSLSGFTVRNHVNNVLSKLQVRDRTEAAVVAVRRGILVPGD